MGGLEAVRREIEAGVFPWRDDLEDLHMNIEVRLHELIGEPAARLHTARSRNDQVATATRLYVREAIDGATTRLRDLQDALLTLAERHADALLSDVETKYPHWAAPFSRTSSATRRNASSSLSARRPPACATSARPPPPP